METKDVLIGIVIGLAIAHIFLRPQQSQQLAQLQFYRMQNKIQQLEYQLQLYQQPHQQQQLQPQIQGTYKNDEKWEILRDKSGFISNIRVIRDAKTT